MTQCSVRNLAWVKLNTCHSFIEQISSTFSATNEIVFRLLASKFNSIDEVEFFLNGDISSVIPNKIQFLDLDRAMNLLHCTMRRNAKIAIFGDYDVDGITSATILYRYLKEIGYNAELLTVYIPDRVKEGYGPNIEAFESLIKKHVKLCITVDCGATANKEIELAQSKGMKVIVLDHHLVSHVPKDIIMVNPNRSDESCEFKNLAAVGVVFLFLVEFNKFIGRKLSKSKIANLLPFVALGTICDQVLIDKANLMLIRKGIDYLNNKHIGYGIRYLIKLLGLGMQLSIDEMDFAYKIGPAINAGGRIGKESDIGFKVLSDHPSYKEYAEELIGLRKRRVIKESDFIESVVDALEPYCSDKEKCSVVIHSDNPVWHVGIMGIIASRIKDIMSVPVFVIVKSNQIFKGSARSVPGVSAKDIVEGALKAGLLIEAGGHAMAAGFSIKEENIELFKKFVEQFCFSKRLIINQEKRILYNTEISVEDLNIGLYNEIRKLSPFGNGNDVPKFVIRAVIAHDFLLIKGKHLAFKMRSKKSSSSISAIMFNASSYYLNCPQFKALVQKKQSILDVMGSIAFDDFYNRDTVKFFIHDIMLYSNESCDMEC